MRKTKIVCTIGPACSDEATLEQLCLAGMNVARLNFSHGTHEEHKRRIEMIKKIRKKLNLPIGILLDTKGPEYRIGVFKNVRETIKEGDTFTFTIDDIEGDNTRVSVSYKGLPRDIEVGDRILVNNGLLIFDVTAVTERDVICKVVAGGVISDRKSMSFPNKVLKQVYLSEQDKADLIFGLENDVDFIACSFVSCKQDIIDVKKFIRPYVKDNSVSLIAKIENRAGIDNIDAICAECDGVMIGRGDMGVEIPFEELPAIQKKIITKCRLLGKRVITATEMLESMITNPRPTRAEISDVANAVYDGTSAIMLSGETAAGKYPALSTETMAKIAEHTEQNIHYNKRFRNTEFNIANEMDAISHSICGIAMDVDAKAIAVCSISGKTAMMVSRFRSPVDIIALSVSEKTYHQLSLSWGVTPVMCDLYPSIEVLFYAATNITRDTFRLQPGDNIVVTGGSQTGASGNTNTIRIQKI
ncbi:MAG: pyruvate kinase [Oscillospiraceae bacterium]|nr:pyruvate kinase [Oscillospiraceae bacterium]